jgi:hypothetical protein
VALLSGLKPVVIDLPLMGAVKNMAARERKLFKVENVPNRYAVKEGDPPWRTSCNDDHHCLLARTKNYFELLTS